MMHTAGNCRDCAHFDNSPGAVEAAFPGLTCFGSAHSAVRADDGLCGIHSRYVTASSQCREHCRRAPRSAIAPA